MTGRITLGENGLRTLHFDDGRKWLVTKSGVLMGAPAEVIAWTNAELNDNSLPPVTEAAFGILRRGLDIVSPEWLERNLPQSLIGGVYFFSSRWADIEACVVVRDKLAGDPAVIRDILRYPFEQLRKRRITVQIDDYNETAIRTAERLGFEIECIREGAGLAENDVVQMVLRRENVRFVNVEMEVV